MKSLPEDPNTQDSSVPLMRFAIGSDDNMSDSTGRLLLYKASYLGEKSVREIGGVGRLTITVLLALLVPFNLLDQDICNLLMRL